MRIIADTHIFYYLASNNDLLSSVSGELICPTFINILELSKTNNLIKKEELVRQAVRKIFHFKENVIYEPPFIHIAQMNCEFEYDVVKEFGDFLEFTSQFASGVPLDKSKVDLFTNWTDKIRAGYDDATKFANNTVEEIRQNISSKHEHRKKDTLQLTGGFIEECVKASTKGACNLEGFDLQNIELLVKTLDAFFKELELSKMKMEANDWLDFALLAYVQPGDKIWTTEKLWLRMIETAGCNKYLYSPPKIVQK